MKIFRITRKQSSYFRNMDPWGYLERLAFPNYFALGATVEQGIEPSEISVGLIICCVRSNSLMIEWLYVSKEYRMRGIGEQLLLHVYEIAAQKGYQNLCACFNPEYGREQVYALEEQYFAERLFEREQSIAKEWMTNLLELESLPYLQKKAEINHTMVPLSAIGIEKLSQDLQVLAQKQDAFSLYSVEGKSQLFDFDISVVMYEDERICGGLLIQCIKSVEQESDNQVLHNQERETLCPVFLYSESKEDEKNLIYCAFLLAQKKYKKDTAVRIILQDEKGVELLEEIMPKQKTRSKLLYADVSEYVSFMQELERAKAYDYTITEL